MKKWASAFTVASCATLLLACGGGSDGPPAPAPSVSVGTITGFGSVIVNGVRFDDAGAAVLINDQVATSTQLKVGMVVAVEGSVSACPNADTALCEGIATRIRFRNHLVGPITTINRLTNTVQVMGRDVVVDDSTVFDGTTAADLSGLSVGDTVAVSGLSEQARVRARFMQRLGTFANGMTPITLHGVVANVDAMAGTCTVDGVPVGFSGLPAGDLPAGGLGNGQYVVVQGTHFGSGLMTADRIQLRDRISYPDASLVEVEGYVSGFVSVANFMVDGQLVDASTAIFRNGTAADLADGVQLEVEGTMVGTVLMARKVIFKLETNVQIVAPIQSKDANTAALVLLGQDIATTPLTQFIDHASIGSPPIRNLGFADLTVADRVDVRAYLDGTGALVATRVERTDPDTVLIAKGPVDAKVPATAFTLLGIEVLTGPATRYRDTLGDLITDIEFYDLVQVPPAVPSMVRAQGIASLADASTIDATRTSSTRGEVEIAY